MSKLNRYLIAVILSISFLNSNNCYANSIQLKNYRIIKVIKNAARFVGVDEDLLLAICWTESSFRPRSVMDGPTMSYGLCQVKLETAQHLDWVYNHKVKATAERLKNDYVNAFYAAKLIRFNLFRYKGNIARAVEAYNRGHSRDVRTPYVKKVMKDYSLVKNTIKFDLGE